MCVRIYLCVCVCVCVCVCESKRAHAYMVHSQKLTASELAFL